MTQDEKVEDRWVTIGWHIWKDAKGVTRKYKDTYEMLVPGGSIIRYDDSDDNASMVFVPALKGEE